MRVKPGDKVEVSVSLGKCPCGRKIWASTNPCAVIHDLPICQEYHDLEPVQFLSYVRRSRGLPDASNH